MPQSPELPESPDPVSPVDPNPRTAVAGAPGAGTVVDTRGKVPGRCPSTRLCPAVEPPPRAAPSENDAGRPPGTPLAVRSSASRPASWPLTPTAASVNAVAATATAQGSQRSEPVPGRSSVQRRTASIVAAAAPTAAPATLQ